MATRLGRWLLVLVVVGVASAGCAGPLQAPAGPVPELGGTWTGTWGDQPAQLVVTEQHDRATGGIDLGPWTVFGRPLPGVSGVLTFASAGQPVTVSVRGRLGEAEGRLKLVLESVAADGPSLSFSDVTETRLAGVGRSSASWQPSGQVELHRAPTRP